MKGSIITLVLQMGRQTQQNEMTSQKIYTPGLPMVSIDQSGLCLDLKDREVLRPNSLFMSIHPTNFPLKPGSTSRGVRCICFFFSFAWYRYEDGSRVRWSVWTSIRVPAWSAQALRGYTSHLGSPTSSLPCVRRAWEITLSKERFSLKRKSPVHGKLNLGVK